MIIFQDRHDAGKQLAKKLSSYKERSDVLVLGLPRGGVILASEVSKALHLPLDVICPKKITSPMNPEYALGAITDTGKGVFNTSDIPQEFIEKAQHEAKQRTALLRKGRPPLEVKNKTVIIIDDGLATGLTMQAAIQALRSLHAAHIVVAIPVSPPDTLEEIKALADTVICLYSPDFFYAVGQFYEVFEQTSLEEVARLL